MNLIFDLDGTLIDSAPDLHAAANKMLATYKLPPLPLETIISFIGNGVPKLVERCMAANDKFSSAQAVAAFQKFYGADPFTLTRPYSGVVDCLKALKSADAKIAVCTNKPEAPARVILDGLGLTQYFDVIVGGDTYPTMKPDPAPLHGCAEQLGGSVIYVGDSETDALAASNAGMTFALFSGGYRNTPTAEMAHDFLFDDFAQLTEYAK